MPVTWRGDSRTAEHNFILEAGKNDRFKSDSTEICYAHDRYAMKKYVQSKDQSSDRQLTFQFLFWFFLTSDYMLFENIQYLQKFTANDV